MKEIKFRAWHEKLNRMIYNLSVKDSISEWVDENGKGWCFEEDIMQYTGLKDRNGKEIYEGDIIEYRNKVLIIGFCKASASFGLYEKDIDDIKNYYWFDNDISESEIEIIGNIYENQELLEQMNEHSPK
jgi:uncharacterized phage protein (TIGR01671 family)